MRLIVFVNYLISLYNSIYGDDDVDCKNIVIDYVTQAEACKIIGISEKSTPLINRWIKQGKIKGTFKFGKTVAVPVSWVKSECNARGISWVGVQVEEGKTEVSLKDYEPLIDYTKKNHLKYGTIHSQIARGLFKEDFIRFDTSFGIRK